MEVCRETKVSEKLRLISEIFRLEERVVAGSTEATLHTPAGALAFSVTKLERTSR